MLKLCRKQFGWLWKAYQWIKMTQIDSKSFVVTFLLPCQGIFIKCRSKENLSSNKNVPKSIGKKINCRNFPPWFPGDLKNVLKFLTIKALNWTLVGANESPLRGIFRELFDELRSMVEKLF